MGIYECCHGGAVNGVSILLLGLHDGDVNKTRMASGLVGMSMVVHDGSFGDVVTCYSIFHETGKTTRWQRARRSQSKKITEQEEFDKIFHLFLATINTFHL